MSDKKDILDQLDASINAIETHREATQKQRQTEAQKVDQVWAAVVESAKKLRAKLVGNEKLRYFTISRDQTEITVSFRSTDPGGKGHMINYNRHHPQGKYPGTDAVWVNEPGRREERMVDEEAAVKRLVHFCASNLTR